MRAARLWPAFIVDSNYFHRAVVQCFYPNLAEFSSKSSRIAFDTLWDLSGKRFTNFLIEYFVVVPQKSCLIVNSIFSVHSERVEHHTCDRLAVVTFNCRLQLLKKDNGLLSILFAPRAAQPLLTAFGRFDLLREGRHVEKKKRYYYRFFHDFNLTVDAFRVHPDDCCWEQAISLPIQQVWIACGKAIYQQ